MLKTRHIPRHKPLFKRFVDLKGTIPTKNKNKLLRGGFNKKKWESIKTKLRRQKRYKFYNQNTYRALHFIQIKFKKNFKNRLLLKQGLKIFYGKYSNKKFKSIINKSITTGKAFNQFYNSSQAFMNLLESRLDIILYRAHFAWSLRNARQSVIHGGILLNGKKIFSPNILIKKGDLITICPKYFNTITAYFSYSNFWPIVPQHLEVNYKILEIFVIENINIYKLTSNFPFFFNLKKLFSYYRIKK